MSYGSLHGPGQIYGWRIILFLLNSWLIMLPGVVAQTKQGVTEIDKGCFSFVFPTLWEALPRGTAWICCSVSPVWCWRCYPASGESPIVSPERWVGHRCKSPWTVVRISGCGLSQKLICSTACYITFPAPCLETSLPAILNWHHWHIHFKKMLPWAKPWDCQSPALLAPTAALLLLS